MGTEMQLEEYLSNGVENIVKDIIKVSFKNPKSSIFMMKQIIKSREAKEKRQIAEKSGEHIPAFLIASITEQCNLNCKGCYARANHNCTEIYAKQEEGVLTESEWGNVFSQAKELGIQFILLAGGEPFARKEVLLLAGKHSDILFPIFTNGTLIDEDYIQVLKDNRNLLPLISIEGSKDTTDERRGDGVYQKVELAMKQLHKNGILFGSSVTVTKENMREVLGHDFIKNLKTKGSKAIVYVEYVPMDKKTETLALDNDTRQGMMKRLDLLRRDIEDLVLIAFPGAEKASGGCLAAGRGFFHINARGDAEPCPFSPYSDTNVKNTPLKQTLQSPLFNRLKKNGNLMQEHEGGCVLFQQSEQVEAILGDIQHDNKRKNFI